VLIAGGVQNGTPSRFHSKIYHGREERPHRAYERGTFVREYAFMNCINEMVNKWVDMYAWMQKL